MRPLMRLRARAADDNGSAAAELVLITPLLLMILMFTVAAGRLTSGRLQVDSAAMQAARAASLARNPAAAAAQAQATAQTALASDHITCDPLTVTPGTADFRPGGKVSVQVSCTVSLAGLTLLHLPGSQTLTASFTSPIDVYRGESLGFSSSDGSSGTNQSTGGA